MSGPRRLPGIIELSVHGRGPTEAYLFDGHRFALGCWAKNVSKGPALLVTLDRHFDTVIPNVPIPQGLSVPQYDAYAFEQLDERNYSHILAAMDARIISDAIIIARARPVGSVGPGKWIDSSGTTHEIVGVKTVDDLSFEFGTSGASPESKRACKLIQNASHIIFDIDLDCFTSFSDAEAMTVLPWPKDVIENFLLPRGSEAFWNSILEKCHIFTFAREPLHCGGVVAGNDLFKLAAEVVFEKLLHAQLP
jgi:hypothetical protein